MTLRVLAKYLGFLIFLPYQNVPVTTSSVEERSQVEPCGILQCVRDCYTNSDKLCVTIPWVVEFCGMMDAHATTVPHYHQLLTSLIVIYRSLSAGVVEGDGSLTTGHMLLLTSLGWLFELHVVTNGIFHDEMQQHNDTTCNCTMVSWPHTYLLYHMIHRVVRWSWLMIHYYWNVARTLVFVTIAMVLCVHDGYF